MRREPLLKQARANHGKAGEPSAAHCATLEEVDNLSRQPRLYALKLLIHLRLWQNYVFQWIDRFGNAILAR